MSSLPTKKQNMAHYSLKRVEALFAEWGEPKYRAKQLIRWIWRENVWEFEKMSNFNKGLRAKLEENFVITLPKIIRTEESEDGTIKYLMQLDDLRTVETVWIPRRDQDRVTVCVSSQIGCKMGCTFCLTAQQKVERNLEPGEIAGQILALPNRDQVTNCVLMGMGEPFDNYDNLIEALDLMSDQEALSIAPRRITVSTSGLVPAIRKFVKDSKCKLAVSLNAPNDAIRDQIMPINKAYNMESLLGTLKELSKTVLEQPGGRNYRVTFEYILIKDLNDQEEHARELIRKLHGLPCKMNLLLYNENPNLPYKRPDMGTVERFQKILMRAHILSFVRNSRGRDISAACGQLASEHERTTGSIKLGSSPVVQKAKKAFETLHPRMSR